MTLTEAELLTLLEAAGAAPASASAMVNLLSSQRAATFQEIVRALRRIEVGEAQDPVLPVSVMVQRIINALEALKKQGL